MENLFVTYETALALKEKGFSEKCLFWWVHNNLLTDDVIFLQYKKDVDFAFAPTHMQVINWFRASHKIKIIESDYYTDFTFGSFWYVKQYLDKVRCNGLDNAIKKAIILI